METLVADVGNETGYVAEVPGFTATVWIEKIDWVPCEAPTSNCKEEDVPPPGAGVWTVTEVIPVLATCAAETWAVSWVALTYCVASAEDPQ